MINIKLVKKGFILVSGSASDGLVSITALNCLLGDSSCFRKIPLNSDTTDSYSSFLNYTALGSEIAYFTTYDGSICDNYTYESFDDFSKQVKLIINQ